MKKILKHPIVKGLIVFFIFYYSSYLQYIPIELFNIKSITPVLNVLLNTFSNIIICIIFYFMYREELIKEWKIFKENKLECLNTGFIYWALGFAIMIASNILINALFHGAGAGNEKIVQSMINTLPWVMLINAGIFAPFNEEIVFRKVLKNIFKSKWTFALLSGFIFGYLHVAGNLNSYVDFLYIIPYGIFGVTFSLAYYKTNTIFTSLTYHMMHNTALLLFSILI